MTNIIEELYYGNIRPGEAGFLKDSAYAKKFNEIIDCQQKLNGVLKGSNKQCFDKFCDAQSELNAMSSSSSFINGFSLGAKFIIEVTKDDENDFTDVL